MRNLIFIISFIIFSIIYNYSYLYALGVGANGSISFHYTGKRLLAGPGLVIDTNCSLDKLFNYRINIGYDVVNQKYLKVNLNRLKIDNTFGFGVFRNSFIRFFLGPQICIHYFWGSEEKNSSRISKELITRGGSNYKYIYHNAGPGIGILFGLNLNFPNNITLSFDIIGRVNIYWGSAVSYHYMVVNSSFTTSPIIYKYYYDDTRSLWGTYEALLNISIIYRINET